MQSLLHSRPSPAVSRTRDPRALRPWLAVGVLSVALSGAQSGAASAIGLTSPVAANGAGTAPGQPDTTVQLRKVDRLFIAEGLIESSRQATVAAQVNGVVVQALVDAGQSVRKGQLLAVIDPREVTAGRDAAAAQVGVADSRVADARQAWERTRSLRERNFVSQAALDQAKAALDAAEAGLRAARAGEALAGVQQQHARVVAPQDGVVAARLAEVGELASPGRPLFIIHQPGDLRVVASVPASLPLEGRALRVAAIDAPVLGRTLQAGKVTVLPAADARDLSRRIRIDLNDETALVPGLAVKVSLALESVDRLVVPTGAVNWRGELATVRVQTADGRTILRQVRLGDAYAGGWTEVLAGLSAGERVLTTTSTTTTTTVRKTP